MYLLDPRNHVRGVSNVMWPCPLFTDLSILVEIIFTIIISVKPLWCLNGQSVSTCEIFVSQFSLIFRSCTIVQYTNNVHIFHTLKHRWILQNVITDHQFLLLWKHSLTSPCRQSSWSGLVMLQQSPPPWPVRCGLQSACEPSQAVGSLLTSLKMFCCLTSPRLVNCWEAWDNQIYRGTRLLIQTCCSLSCNTTPQMCQEQRGFTTHCSNLHCLSPSICLLCFAFIYGRAF